MREKTRKRKGVTSQTNEERRRNRIGCMEWAERSDWYPRNESRNLCAPTLPLDRKDPRGGSGQDSGGRLKKGVLVKNGAPIRAETTRPYEQTWGKKLLP